MQPHPLTTERESIAQETIAAISTPPGRGGIGIVRLSGPHALEIAQGLIRLKGSLSTPPNEQQAHRWARLEHTRARLAEIPDPEEPESGRAIDEAVVTYFAAPHTYTGEDLVEIAAHGSPVILELLVRQALRAGARLARPGEFTERAFLSGRIDLPRRSSNRTTYGRKASIQEHIYNRRARFRGGIHRRV